MRALIVGAGAQGRVILEILRAQGTYESIAFIDDSKDLWGQLINEAVVVGGLDFALQQDRRQIELIVALGNNLARLAIAQRLKEHSIALLNAVHPSAVIMPTVRMGEGNMIGAVAVVNANARIGSNVIINTGAVVEHDCILADGVSISPGVHLGGRVALDRAAFIGTGAILLPRISIGATSVVAAGAVVTRDVPEEVLVRGVPARIVEKVDETFDWRRLL